MGSSFLSAPTITTVPCCGFSFAVSGIIIPLEVFSSASEGFTRIFPARIRPLSSAILKNFIVVQHYQNRITLITICAKGEMAGIPGRFRTILHQVKLLLICLLNQILTYLTVLLYINLKGRPDIRTKKSVSI